MTGGQGLGWIDTKIMRAADLNIGTVPYETVFDMVQGGRLDYFPRGVIEALMSRGFGGVLCFKHHRVVGHLKKTINDRICVLKLRTNGESPKHDVR